MSEFAHTSPVRSATARPWLVAAVVAALVHVILYDALRDDAYITFRYARNLAEGHGAVFNPGEFVEGYSNFLLMVILAAANGLLGLPIVGTAVAVGYVSVVGTIVVAARLASKSSGDGIHGTWSAWVLASTGSFAAYGACGLETSLFTFGCVSALAADRARRPILVGIIAGLATMTRPDGGILYLAAVLGALFAKEARLSLVGCTTLGYAAVIAPWFWWRVAYYGHLVPNQIEAKRGMDLLWQLELGAKYVVRAGIVHAPLVVLVVMAFVLVTARLHIARPRLRKSDATLLFAAAGFFAFPVVTGGDWMPAYRFVVPAAVLGAVLAIRALDLCKAPTRSATIAIALVVVSSFGISFFAKRMMPETHEQNRTVEGEIHIGQWLRRSLPPGTWTAAWANGAIPFHSGLPTIDLLGLTDEHIARRGQRLVRGPYPGHIAFDQEYVVRRAPTIITYMHQSGFQPTPRDDRFEAYRADYDNVTFEFTKWKYAECRFASVWIRRSELEWVVSALEDAEAGIVRVD